LDFLSYFCRSASRAQLGTSGSGIGFYFFITSDYWRARQLDQPGFVIALADREFGRTDTAGGFPTEKLFHDPVLQ